MTNHARGQRRPIRVMQSFGKPRPTTNPYIHMLDDALAQTDGVDHVRFGRRRALLGRYDVVQFHWPDTLFGGSTRLKAVARMAFALALRARLALTPVAVVRTVHNLQPHSGSTPWERRYLEWLDRRTDHRILLNEHTPAVPGVPSTLIVHGHYRDWFASVPAIDSEPGTLGFVGLLRPYKGVEELLAAFVGTASATPDLRLRIAGDPTSAALEEEIRSRAAADPRIELDLRYLPEDEFANAVMRCAGVVLPYRAMHNSGSALAVLSLRRPVLVPRNDVTEALSAEVGDGWVTTFEGTLSARDLQRFATAVEQLPAVPPDLARREWALVGAQHRAVFRAAVARRRGRSGR